MGAIPEEARADHAPRTYIPSRIPSWYLVFDGTLDMMRADLYNCTIGRRLHLTKYLEKCMYMCYPVLL
jgi:hypothetical protein